jgi:hypothetical protein
MYTNLLKHICKLKLLLLITGHFKSENGKLYIWQIDLKLVLLTVRCDTLRLHSCSLHSVVAPFIRKKITLYPLHSHQVPKQIITHKILNKSKIKILINYNKNTSIIKVNKTF